MPGEKRIIEARTLKGFQDLLPADAMSRRSLVATIVDVFEKYGFLPVETPALEHLDILLGTGGEETNKELYRLESPEGEPVGMRFDHTVPFARLLAQYPDKLKAPFRRYAFGPVWRADRPGPGRFREFAQLDIDAAGSASVAVDAEVVAVMCEAMQALGVTQYTALVSDRMLMDGLLEGCGIAEPARQKHVLRVIDKLAKVGLDNVCLELGDGRIDDSGDPIPGVRLDATIIAKICEFVAVKGATRAEVIEQTAKRLPDNETSAAALDELRELAQCLDALGVAEEHARFDPSLARGLDYYTGPVFEMVLPGAPDFGSVMGGGRYNQLVERFLERPIPCTGMAVGLDRLIAALASLGLAAPAKKAVQVLVATVGKIPPAEPLRAAAELRAAGIRTEAYFGKKRGMKHQLSHADHYEIPVAVILGGDELANGVVSIKDLAAGKRLREGIEEHEAYRQAGKTAQVTVPRDAMIATVQEMLGIRAPGPG